MSQHRLLPIIFILLSSCGQASYKGKQGLVLTKAHFTHWNSPASDQKGRLFEVTIFNTKQVNLTIENIWIGERGKKPIVSTNGKEWNLSVKITDQSSLPQWQNEFTAGPPPVAYKGQALIEYSIDDKRYYWQIVQCFEIPDDIQPLE